MEDFTPLGYVTIDQAVDAVGRSLMPHQWLGVEADLLKRDTTLTDEGVPPIVAEEEATTDTPAGRLNRALNYLIRALAAGDLSAVAAHEDGEIHPFPSMLWTSRGIRGVFRAGEVPVHLRVALEGHKAGAGKRWVLLPQSELRRYLREAGPPEAVSVEDEFRAWLAKRLEQCAEEERPSRKQLWIETQAAFGTRLPYRSFNRIWSAMARPSKPSS